MGWLAAPALVYPMASSRELVGGVNYSYSQSNTDQPPLCGRFCVAREGVPSSRLSRLTSGMEGGNQLYRQRRLNGSVLFLLLLVLPFFIIGFCYFKIFVKVRRDMVVREIAGCALRLLIRLTS